MLKAGPPPQIIVIPQSMLSQQTRNLLQYRMATTTNNSSTMQPIIIQQQPHQPQLSLGSISKRAVMPIPRARPVAAVVGSKRPAPTPSPTNSLGSVDSVKEEDEEEVEEYELESDLQPARKRANLDHLSPEERLMRRKMKNRVAAQTARDKKKAYMDEMEQLVAGLKGERAKLAAEKAALAAANERLLQENLLLREENTQLLARLGASPQEQQQQQQQHGVDEVLDYAEDLSVEDASFIVVATEDLSSSTTSCDDSSSSLSAAADVAAIAAAGAQPPEPAVLANPQQQDPVVSSSVAMTAAALACAAAPSSPPPHPLSDHVLSSKGLTTGPTVGPSWWWGALLQTMVMVCWAAYLGETACRLALTPTLSTRTTAAASASSSATTTMSSAAISPCLPLKKRGRAAWCWEERTSPPPWAVPPPD